LAAADEERSNQTLCSDYKNRTRQKFLEAAGESGWLHLEAQPIAEIVEAQSRSFKVHYNISARAKAGENWV